MAVIRFLGLVTLVAVISGCQSWQYQGIEHLPPTAAVPAVSEPGKVDVWYFDDISGNNVQQLLDSPKYPASPDEVTELNQLERTDSRANSYGTLIRGYLEPPTTGEYTFYISGDDETQLWLSDSQSPDSIVKIASTMATPIGNFSRYSSQTSGVHYLEEGKKYYFELRHKEGGWDDHFSVAWSGPGIPQQIIGGNYLYSWAEQLPGAAQEMTQEEAYRLGYRIGYFDASQGLSYSGEFPPLDEDNDSLYDNWEVVFGLSASNPADATADTDGDLLTALDEFWARTNPTLQDTDGDGLPDGYEYAYGLDPTNPADATIDLDGDGYTVLQEYLADTNPTDATDFPAPEAVYTSGFVGQYFSGANFEDFLYSEKDTNINYNWKSGSPSPEVPKDRFSVRWQGWFTPPHSEGNRQYTFSTTTDDGTRLYVNNALVIDHWKNQSPTTYSATVRLEAGTTVPVTMEYFEFGWDASAALTITDDTTGQPLDTSKVITSLALDSEFSESSLQDNIDDLYKLRYGLPIMQPIAGLTFNNSGVTVLEAYQSGLHPYTLETVSKPNSPDTSGPDGSTPGTGSGETGSSVTLSWTPPGTRVDGSSISLSEIDRYQIHYGQNPQKLNEVVEVPAGTTKSEITNLTPGTWYFNIRVIDTNGLSSEPSDPIEHTVP